MERWALSAPGFSLSLLCVNEFFLLPGPCANTRSLLGKGGRADTKYSNNAILKENTKKCTIISYWEGHFKKLY